MCGLVAAGPQGNKAHRTRLLLFGEFAVAVVNSHDAIGVLALDDAGRSLYITDAERRSEGIATGPLNQRQARSFQQSNIVEQYSPPHFPTTTSHHMPSLQITWSFCASRSQTEHGSGDCRQGSRLTFCVSAKFAILCVQVAYLESQQLEASPSPSCHCW